MRSGTDPELAAEVERAAVDELWRRGELAELKLDSHQLKLYRWIWLLKASRVVLELARRVGKTWLLCVIAIEVCLRKPGARVVYGGPTGKEVAEFIIPTIEAICGDAPADCRPQYNPQTGHYTFPNGAYIHLFGCDDKRKADRGRGPGADLVLLDEAGFIPILRYVLRSVLKPQTLTTGGRTLLASTPAEEPDHDFTRIAEAAEKNGTWATATIYDNPRLTQEQIAAYIAEDARDEGMTVEEYQETDEFKREYLAQRVTDKLLTVVPEWEKCAPAQLLAVPQPECFDAYTVLDPGGADPHGLLFGFYDFKRAALVIEDELLLRNGENTEDLVKLCKEKEKALWGTDLYAGTLRGLADAMVKEAERAVPDWLADKIRQRYPHQPYQRWSDTNLQLIRDLHQLHGVTFIPTAKDDLNWAVNNLRVLMRSGRVLVHPRCVNLDRQLRSTVWANIRRRDFKRKNGEHGDLVAALIYLARNVDQQRNPYPITHGRKADQVPSVQLAASLKKSPNVGSAFLGSTPIGRRFLKR